MRRSLLFAFFLLAAACESSKPSTHAISGTLSGADAGVVIGLTGGPSPVTVVTGASGQYAFRSLEEGTYIVRPSSSYYGFTPAQRTVVLSGGDVQGQDFVATALHARAITGLVAGVAIENVRIDLTGPVSRFTSTDGEGAFRFDGLAAGTYVVTPSALDASFVPRSQQLELAGYDPSVLFRSTPPSAPFTVTIEGDAASGQDGGTFPGANEPLPNPDVIVYDPNNDVWTMNVRFDNGLLSGLGGGILFRGTPAATTYTETTPELFQASLTCWGAQSLPGPNVDQYWDGDVFTLTLTSVGPARQTNVAGTNALVTVVDYPAHGSLHVSCAPDPNSSASGTMTLDTGF